MKRWMCALAALVLLLGMAGCAQAEREEDAGLVAINLQAIKAALDRNGLTYTYKEKSDSFYVLFDLDCKMKSCTAWLIAYDDGVLLQCDLDVKVEKDRENDLALYLMRCNGQTRIGGFYIDFDEHLTGYELFILSDVLPPTQDALDYGLAVGLTMLEDRGDALYDILMNGMTAEEALRLYP